MQQERTKRSEELLSDLTSRGIRFAQIEMPDINGTPRGKIAPIKKALSPVGSGISTLILSARSLDNLCDTAFTSVENGYPKMVALPDYDTLREMPWRPGMATILCDFYMDDGQPCPLDTRHLLKEATKRVTSEGLEARAAIEFECYIFHRDETLLRTGQFGKLVPFGQNRDFYSITRVPNFDDLAVEFISRMADIGIEVEAFHTEYGAGMYEFTLAVMPAVEAADAAMRAKLFLKQLCAERGLVVSFMAKMDLRDEDNACGAHHNLSLWREGTNQFWDPERQGLSSLAEQFAAGLLATAPAMHVVFKPWVNSYRRMDKHAFSPENASWGFDNHSVALRVVYGAAPTKYTRFEHRLAATDVNFHLSLAAILLGGLHGIKTSAMPPALATGDASLNRDFEPLPSNLSDATVALRESSLARELLGDEIVEHFAAVRDEEWQDYSSWMQKQDLDPLDNEITQWELDHYFEWV